MKEIYFKPLFESETERNPILEYNRVCGLLTGGIVEGLMSRGYTEKMAIAFLSSKILRKELDGGLDEHFISIGKQYGQTVAPIYRDDCEKFTTEG